jgi:hypothetical protein
MRPARTSLLVLSLLLATLLAVAAAHRRTVTRDAMEARAALVQESRKLGADIAQAEQEFIAVREAASGLQREVAFLDSVRFTEGPPPDAAPSLAVSEEKVSLEAQENNARNYRSQLVAAYAPFYSGLGLTELQVDAFEALLTEHWHKESDIDAVAKRQHLEKDDPILKSLRDQESAAFAQGKAALLGADGVAKLADYERTLPVRALPAQLAARLYYIDASLTRRQAEDLTELLAHHSAPYREGKAADLEQIDWDAVLPLAQAMLSPPQFAALQDRHRFSVKVKEFCRRMDELSERAGLTDK